MFNVRRPRRKGLSLLAGFMVMIIAILPLVASSGLVEAAAHTKEKPDNAIQLTRSELLVENTVLYAPLDKVLKGFGHTSTLDETSEKIRITAGRKSIEMKLGESFGYLNSLEISLQKPATTVDGVVYVPITFFSDILDLEVNVKDAIIQISEEKEENISRTDKLIYYNEDLMNKSKENLLSGVESYVAAFNKVQTDAEKFMNALLNPVTNKSLLPPSKDKHDYISTAPYFWPDPTKPDGLPWISKDGQVNPASRGDDTDYTRTSEMFHGIGNLSLSYYFTEDPKYLEKAYEIIKVWFIDEETKMNPHIKYGQSVPGGVDGRPLGVIEWTSIVNVITALQMLEKQDMISQDDINSMVDWFTAYASWLTRSDMGIKEKQQHNNHGSNYDYQLAGILLYINNYKGAVQLFEEAKVERIEDYIEPDGSLPYELRRTKSVNYHNTCLWPLIQVAEIAERFTDVDLWNYTSAKGVSLSKAFENLAPYAKNEKEWEWEQIQDSAEIKMATMIRPLFLKTSNIFGYAIDGISEQAIMVSADDSLKYNIQGNDKGILSATYIVQPTAEESTIRLNWMVQKTGAAKYVLYRKDSKDGTYSELTKLDSSKAIQFVDKKDLEYGRTYYYKIQALDANGEIIDELESKESEFSSKWIDLKEKLADASDGEKFTIDLSKCEKIPPFIFNTIKGRDIEFLINTDSKISGVGVSWVVNGTSIEKAITTDIIFDVTNKFSITSNDSMTQLPEGAKTYMKLGRVHISPLGFQAKLNINLGKEYANDVAKLYSFGQGLVEVNSGVKINQDGSVVFDIIDTPDYAIAIYGNDSTAPATTDNAPAGWTNSDVTVELHATDAESGVAATYYSINGGEPSIGSTVSIESEGFYTLQYWSVDHVGNQEEVKTKLIQIDKTAPTVELNLSEKVLWPPNHRMVPITPEIFVKDLLSNVNVVLQSITSNEPDDGLGDGDTANDIQEAEWNTYDLEFLLRAERSGLGAGRTYTVTYLATDEAGNQASTSVDVWVPHSSEK
ncbi:alginate lyase family protein [Paenibacillus sp. NRS-1760]|uniref:alginate lyase family protein n=1 Tax=Paenibacillus sp. NRS-1760 TaxID=3233902 RepID=UPI003D2D701E